MQGEKCVNHLCDSYMVSLRTAKSGKPHTIVETLIMPCCKDIAGYLLREKAASKLNAIPILNNTVHQRIVEMSEDIKNQVISEIKKGSQKGIESLCSFHQLTVASKVSQLCV